MKLGKWQLALMMLSNLVCLWLCVTGFAAGRSLDADKIVIPAQGLKLVDPAGRTVVFISFDANGGRLAVLNREGKVSAAMTVNDQGGELSVCNMQNRPAAVMDVAERTGNLTLLDEQGQVFWGAPHR